ncbi:MAG: 30S ribosomal protein S3 [Candidatus Omnitrophica bacterium]|nr:30S ribosomal protein S3 [Candidatus Omnitrophota bacterium]
MGQKVHPYGIRLGYIKPWRGKWFAKKNFSDLLEEDLKIRDHVKKKLSHAGVGNIEIERSSGRIRVRIFTARPGIIIGRRGQEIEKIKDGVSKLTKSEVTLDIKEIKTPQIEAQLVAENIAMQLEKRIGFRRAMKKVVQTAMQKGALGIKVKCKGRLGGAEIAREEGMHEGKVPLSTFRADIDYGFTEAHTTYGSIGCKVWIYKGDILVKKEEAEQREKRQSRLAVSEEEAAEAREASNPATVAEAEASKIDAPEATQKDSN